MSGIVDWKPKISTTWALACYTQHGCKGGNPAQLFEDIARGGISTDHCIDYSWCEEDPICSGSALSHFDKSKIASEVNSLNSKIPTCGCYFPSKHYLYKIEPNSKSIFIGAEGVTQDNIALLVKKHIYMYGPAMGGFLVFNNFMKGNFSKVNGGVYLERCQYGTELQQGQQLTFSDIEVSASNYKGAHAVAIMGWGIAKNIVVDNGDKKADVPYWYCRNSWDDKWGENGYFKMAMYPWNKIAQFDKRIIIQDESGSQHLGGGIVLIRAIKSPELLDLRQLSEKFKEAKRIEPDTYYKEDGKTAIPSINDKPNIQNNKSTKKINITIIIISVIILLTVLLIAFLLKTKQKTK